ncbi:SusC/RagA family TonB-linked outer membrane protein [Haliscomenobacter hydrossis]|uniref:TonB-dependent receptor plug n=1 Tax=Haliscomenobacter hydrossis (strain ATCC 27775 / DSM 1100 / LMG 10767 / O) TaxID=760192 RepID=F4KVX5_HALH1|nr:SusC/RagA family TonB-linked outer membrane protein [Haliscomenobacter hydrossis]AEE53550.1 TonB-dependent receptor plug [Haliscomenobacter hydrossis DSM 1100]
MLKYYLTSAPFLLRRTFGALLLITGFLVSASAQQRISGKVTDAEGGALPGASVLVQGTTRGTVSGLEGEYTLDVPNNAVLEISFTGFSKQVIVVGNRTVINIVLEEDAQLLNEVTITALGIEANKKNLTYSSQTVDGEELQNTQRDNAFLGLQGRVAGLNLTPVSGVAGGSVNINLRGVNSLGSSNQPLIVLDGLPINSGTMDQHNLHSDATGVNGDVNNNRDDIGSRLAELNPNDIERISILKGPEAAALYGNEGANGVILISTRKGKAGTGKLTYNNRFAASELYLFPEIQTVYGRGRNGGVEVNDPDFFGPKYADGTQFYDNVSNFYQRGSNQRHDLAFEGGSEKITYRMSTSYLDSKGIIQTNRFQQVNAALNTDAQVLKWLKLTSRFSYARNKNVLPPGGGQGYLTALMRFPRDKDARQYENPDGTRILTLPAATPGTDNDNPFFNVNNSAREEQTDRTNANISLKADLTPWLSLTGRFGADIYATNANRFFHPFSNIGFPRGGWLENYTDLGRLLNSNFFANVRKSFGKLSTSFQIGGSLDDRRYETTSVYGEKLFLPDFNSINNVEPTTMRNKTILTRQRLLGAFAQANFTFDEWLTLNVTARNDWSSTLPVENRSYFYPSVGLSWNIMDMPFLKSKPSVVDFFKLRATFAEVGNPAPPYKIRARLVPQTSTGGGFLYDFFGDNPFLKPETVRSYEFGTELGFFKRRLTIEASWFSKTLIDQIIFQRLSYGTGFIFGLLNGGEMNTTGFEVQLGLVPIRTKNFEWELNMNLTHYDTKVLYLPADQSEYYNSDTWVHNNVRASAFAPADLLAARFNQAANRFDPTVNGRGAGSATAIGGFSYLRNSKGQVLINPTTGFPIMNSNFLPIGDRNPDFTMGIVNSFSFKNFNLSFLLDIRKGGDIYNGNEHYLVRNGLSVNTLDRDVPIVFPGVLRDGKEESEAPTVNSKEIIPSANELYYTTALAPEEFVEKDINWLRLRDVTLRFNFPAKMLGNRRAVKELSVFVNGTDLFLITNYTGADPYISVTSPATGGAGGFGLDFGKTSLPRQVSAGVTVTF